MGLRLPCCRVRCAGFVDNGVEVFELLSPPQVQLDIGVAVHLRVVGEGEEEDVMIYYVALGNIHSATRRKVEFVASYPDPDEEGDVTVILAAERAWTGITWRRLISLILPGLVLRDERFLSSSTGSSSSPSRNTAVASSGRVAPRRQPVWRRLGCIGDPEVAGHVRSSSLISEIRVVSVVTQTHSPAATSVSDVEDAPLTVFTESLAADV